jgi:glycosyltransferase involved in cell wall biosynthesis
MKKIINYIGKYLLNLLVKLKKFDIFPNFIHWFPSLRYKAISELMKQGYLDIAYTIIKDKQPKPYEEALFRRIYSMYSIQKEGFILPKNKKVSIQTPRILFAVHNSLPYDTAGYAIRTHTIVSKLKEKKMKLVVASRAGYPWDLQKHRHLDHSIKEDTIDNVQYIRLNDEEKIFKKGSDLEYIETYANKLIVQAKRHKSNIIHASSNYLNAHAGIRAANKLGIPSIYEVRGLWHVTRLTLNKNYKYHGMFNYEEEMIKSATLGADKVVTISQALKDLIVSWGVSKETITVIPNAVDTSLFQPKQKNLALAKKYHLDNQFIIGFIGSLTAYEGLENLINATKQLVEDGLNIVLMIVGDGKEKEKLTKIAKSQHIIFTGRVPHSQVEEYYSLFNICVYPRTNDEVCQYVPPLKPLEAMAMQKAIIVSDVAPLLEMVTDGVNGLVCKSNSIKSLKEKIKVLYLSPQKSENLAKNGYNWVHKNRSWNQLIDQYNELYTQFK